MLYLGSELKKRGFEVAFLLGARSKGDLLELEEFEKIGGVYVSTDDGKLIGGSVHDGEKSRPSRLRP